MSPELRHDLEVLALALGRLVLLMAALVALASSACAPEGPRGVRVTNAGPAFKIILDRFGESAELPPVYLLDADPSCGEVPAYRRDGDGRCVGGEQIPGVGIYLVRRPDGLFTTHFPHEVRHLTGHQHCPDVHCEFTEADADAINRAQWALRFDDANRIAIETEP